MGILCGCEKYPDNSTDSTFVKIFVGLYLRCIVLPEGLANVLVVVPHTQLFGNLRIVTSATFSLVGGTFLKLSAAKGENWTIQVQ